MRRDNFLTISKQVQQGLHLMGKLRDSGKAEHAARPLDGMGRAENLVQQIQIFRILFKRQQPFFDDGQMIAGFFEKGVLKLREIATHS